MWVAVLLSACSQEASQAIETADLLPQPGLDCDYTQTFGNASHTGKACTEISGLRVVAQLTQDADSDAENDAFGFVPTHQSPPLTSGDWVIIGQKSGWTSNFHLDTSRYAVQAYKWMPSVGAPNAQLVPAWNIKSDWQPVNGIIHIGFLNNQYTPQFGLAISGDSVYVPARHGQIMRVDLATGELKATINPFASTQFSGDERLITQNAPSVDTQGNVWYTAVAWQLPIPGDVFGNTDPAEQPRGSFVAEVSPATSSTRVTDFYALSLAAGLPDAFSNSCEYPFGQNGTPAATGPDSRPPVFGCGEQVPAANSPIAFDPVTGDAVLYSYPQNAKGAHFLMTVDPVTMTAINTSDTRGHLFYGCGKRLSLRAKGDNSGTSCKTITANGTVNIGNDPDYNGSVRFRGGPLMDSAVSIAPNGVRSIGGYDNGSQFGGNYDARGSVLAFNPDGSFASAYTDFGWEVTQSMFNGHYLQDRQLFSAGEELGIAQLSPGEQNEVIQTVPADPDANAIDFLDAHIVFDTSGTRYAINADGHLYKFAAGQKHPVETVALTNADGTVRSMDGLSSYFARDRMGRIYVSYAGFVYVVDGGGEIQPGATPHTSDADRARLTAAHAAKVRGVESAPQQTPPVR